MTKQRRILIYILAILVVLFLLELLLRPYNLFNSLGNQLFRLKNYDAAEKLYAHNAQNEDGIASANLAKSRYKKEDYDAAAQAANESLQRMTDSAEVYYDRGNIAFAQEDYQAAVENYEQALILDPEDEDIKANLELALRKLEENPPPPPAPKPQEESEADQRSEEEVRNILEALDNLEIRDRLQQRDKTPAKAENWW